jgi:hypothetical protein
MICAYLVNTSSEIWRGCGWKADYVPRHQLPVGIIQQSARSVRDVLYASATRLDAPVTNGDLLWSAVGYNSTPASIVHGLLSMRGTAGFDERCRSIAMQARALEE